MDKLTYASLQPPTTGMGWSSCWVLCRPMTHKYGLQTHLLVWEQAHETREQLANVQSGDLIKAQNCVKYKVRCMLSVMQTDVTCSLTSTGIQHQNCQCEQSGKGSECKRTTNGNAQVYLQACAKKLTHGCLAKPLKTKPMVLYSCRRNKNIASKMSCPPQLLYSHSILLKLWKHEERSFHLRKQKPTVLKKNCLIYIWLNLKNFIASISCHLGSGNILNVSSTPRTPHSFLWLF